MLPVNADEADLAAQCVAARGQAEDVLRLIRENAGDLALTIRLNAQYASMMRTSVSVRGLLMRVQAVRRKREAIESAATQDAWILHIAEQSMRKVADPPMEQVTAAQPEAAPAEAPAQRPDQGNAENVSHKNTNSHDTAFETWMSERPWNRPGETALRKRVREAMDAGLRSAWQEQRDQQIAENVSNNDPNSHDVAFETWLREKPWKRPDKTDLRARVHGAMVAELRTAWHELSANGCAGPGGTESSDMPSECPDGRQPNMQTDPKPLTLFGHSSEVENDAAR